MTETPILEARNLSKHFTISAGVMTKRTHVVRAVDGLNFDIAKGETLALVGESGCGKTTTTRLLLRLQDPTHGSVRFAGEDVHALKGAALRKYRSRVQAVFQDPWSSINPRVRIRDFVAEPLVVNENLTSGEVDRRVHEALDAVGLGPAHASKFPHEFSGGQRQRIAIASAMVSRPELVVLDEPVSGLDVSIRSQIINLLKDMQAEYGVSFLLVAHDLATTRYLADRVAVMYLGSIVEMGKTDDVFDRPSHPYTEALISAALPSTPGMKRNEIVLGGEVPSPLSPPSGCTFHPRCHRIIGDVCVSKTPVLSPDPAGHCVGCHLY
ncbi:peptide/nickel transport system ATP-binding protein [Poseidonocella pacifica]|uniref:Peptide/nickel transport system ATP-binding protein n=1 Tax=Poseidonocella pacifica TaxID=871651 RepID=A0A1I0YDX0_9RHOB|nr:oligopeptide/dipeptide ABC transporter ATP-binding protein [Poseidonocella pacifica]SFB10720.1 peptide/nickel transport system ATP-binding protein [Poseidonocella pacifica]